MYELMRIWSWRKTCQLHGVDRREQPVLVEAASTQRLAAKSGWKVVTMPIIGPQLPAHGRRVKLIAPQFVKPYVKSNKAKPGINLVVSERCRLIIG